MHILFGRLRRDTMILNSGEDASALEKEAEEAVRTGRMQETFLVACSAYFTASAIAWDPEGNSGEASSVPPLNPGGPEDEQERTDQKGAREMTSIPKEREAIAAESPVGPDTGSNPDLTPTGAARSQAELEAGKESGSVERAEQKQAEAAKAKTSAFDAEIEKVKKDEKKS